jgi:hypothetical protein
MTADSSSSKIRAESDIVVIRKIFIAEADSLALREFPWRKVSTHPNRSHLKKERVILVGTEIDSYESLEFTRRKSKSRISKM